MNYFWHLMWKTFCFLDRANSIKTNLQTYNLQIGQYNYKYKSVNQFWWNLPYPNGKKFSRWNAKTFSHLQLGIFCHFDVCHSRRNALGFSDIPLSSRWGKSLIWFFLCMVQFWHVWYLGGCHLSIFIRLLVLSRSSQGPFGNCSFFGYRTRSNRN